MGIEEQILDLVEKRGVNKGIDETKRQIVRNLKLNLGYTDKQTAEMVQVSVKFVKEACKLE